MTDWLISEVPGDIEGALLDDQALGALTQSRGEPSPPEPPLAVSINDIVIHDTRKWLGGDAIRLDVLVVHGNAAGTGADGWYTPTTRVFPDVRDGQRLNAEGMLLFLGWPRHFLDLFIIASRDTKDAEGLGDLLRDRLAGDDTQGAVGHLAALVAAPEAMVVAAAAKAALTVGSLAYDVVRTVTSKSVGVYQRSWLEHADAFGLGRHPAGAGERIRAEDFSFWLNVRRDVAT